MGDIMQQRRDSTTDWSGANPVVPDGQFALERVGSGAGSTFTLKIGNGVDHWDDLPEWLPPSATPGLPNVIATLNTDVSAQDPLDQQWLSGTFTPDQATVDVQIMASIFTNGTGSAGIQMIWSQSVTSGNLWSNVVNGTVSGAHRTKVFGAVPGTGKPFGQFPTPTVGTLGAGTINDVVRLTGLTPGTPVYFQLVPFLLDAGTPICQLPAAATFICVGSSGTRAYALAFADLIPIELGRSPEDWIDSQYPPVLAAFPAAAFVTSDDQSIWTTGTAVGAIQVFDADSFAIQSGFPAAVSGMVPIGMCQDPTGTRTIDLAHFGAAYVTPVGSTAITTFSPAFTPADVGKILSGPMAQAFPAGTKVAGFVNSQQITTSAGATTAVTLGNVDGVPPGTPPIYTPLVLDGIAYVCDQGTGHNRIQLFDVVSGAAVTTFALTSGYVPYSIAVSPDGTKLAVRCIPASGNNRLVILNAQTGAVIVDLDTGGTGTVLPIPCWEPDSAHGWIGVPSTNKVRRFDLTSIESAHDISFFDPTATVVSPTGLTLFVVGGSTSGTSPTWAYFAIGSNLPTGAPPIYDSNHSAGALTHIAIGPDLFIYYVGTNGYLNTIRGGSMYCFAGSSPSTQKLQVLAQGAH